VVDVKSELYDKYQKEVVPAMKEKFGIKNIMAVPRLDKIVVNMGVGEAMTDLKILEVAADDLAAITGQKPSMRRSKKAISNFHLRIGAPVGCKVTLRRQRMYEFMERLINVVLPRIRDFNGISRKSFDREGNYSLGLKEQSIFPEIDPTRRDFRAQGMDITFVIKGGNAEKNLEYLSLMGVPFSKPVAVVEPNKQ
jgi:large subunit ribosomal protein L5